MTDNADCRKCCADTYQQQCGANDGRPWTAWQPHGRLRRMTDVLGMVPMQQPISVSGQTFYGIDGKPMSLMGVNWFGFETSATAVAGLWQVRACSGTLFTGHCKVTQGRRLCMHNASAAIQDQVVAGALPFSPARQALVRLWDCSCMLLPCQVDPCACLNRQFVRMQGPTALSQDFSTVLYRIQLLGFNTIRLPFSFTASGRAPCSEQQHWPRCNRGHGPRCLLRHAPETPGEGKDGSDGNSPRAGCFFVLLLPDEAAALLQVLFNTAPTSYTAACTPVTNNQVSQSVIPAGANVPSTATAPPPVSTPTLAK